MSDIARQALKEMFNDLFSDETTEDEFLENCVDLTISMVNAVKVVNTVSTDKPCWLPISTAPKDGTYVLLANPSLFEFTPLRVEVGAWYPYRYDAAKGAWCNDVVTSFDVNNEPLYWHPLPQVPK